jgi:hypothetical protein
MYTRRVYISAPRDLCPRISFLEGGGVISMSRWSLLARWGGLHWINRFRICHTNMHCCVSAVYSHIIPDLTPELTLSCCVPIMGTIHYMGKLVSARWTSRILTVVNQIKY